MITVEELKRKRFLDGGTLIEDEGGRLKKWRQGERRTGMSQ